MSRYVFKLPDLGEGTVAAEIVKWCVKPGDIVEEESVLVEIMTEKAVVEVPAPVSGKVLSITGNAGDSVPVGAELAVFETDVTAVEEKLAEKASATPVAAPSAKSTRLAQVSAAATAERDGRVLTSPAIRRRAHEAGIDLTQITGSGPNGRIMRADLEQATATSSTAAARAARAPSPAPVAAISSARAPTAATEEIKVIGLRRLIAQRMSESKRNIPHFAYVEEVDVTELESLRVYLNAQSAGEDKNARPTLTYLPFLALALTRVLKDFPQCNALYDEQRGLIVRHQAVHLGVATQTPDGLKVPVVRDAQTRSLWQLATEIRRVSQAARANRATKEELTGSTITITSLGKLGGIASTPIINAPEMGIIGVNRAVERPMVVNGQIAVRRMMNLSSSFDHRFVDGFDAAAMIQALKEKLEHPATIFL